MIEICFHVPYYSLYWCCIDPLPLPIFSSDKVLAKYSGCYIVNRASNPVCRVSRLKSVLASRRKPVLPVFDMWRACRFSRALPSGKALSIWQELGPWVSCEIDAHEGGESPPLEQMSPVVTRAGCLQAATYAGNSGVKQLLQVLHNCT